MTSLGEIKAINDNITNSKLKPLKVLHVIIVGDNQARLNRNTLRRFSGFGYEVDADDYNAKFDEIKAVSETDLIAICHMLNLNYAGNKDEVANRILNFLCHLEMPEDNEGDADEEEEDEEPAAQAEDETRTYFEDENRRDEQMHSPTERVGIDTELCTGMNKIKLKSEPFALSFRDVEDSIKSFSGKDGYPVRRWVIDFEETAQLLGWTDLQKLIFAKRSLSGLAKLAVQAERGVTTWNNLKQLLLKEFDSRVNSADVHRTLMNRKKKKEESLQEYVLIMKEIASRSEIEEEVTIQYIVDGIVDDVNNKTMLYSATTFEQLKEKVKLYDLVKSKTTATPEAKPEKRERMQPVKYTNPRKPLTNIRETEETRCFNCGEKGHMSRTCPSKSKGLKCFSCNEYGHKSADCTKPKVRLATVRSAKSQAIRSINLGDKKLSALLDTGSDVNLIRLKDFLTLKKTLDEESTITLYGIGNQKLITLGSFETEIGLDHAKVKTKLHVVPTEAIKTSVIIGYELLKQAKVVIDQDGVKVMEEASPAAKEDEIKINEEMKTENEEIAAILNIDCGNFELDLNHIKSKDIAEEIRMIFNDYDPIKYQTKAAPIKTKIIVKDDTPVYQKPRRLSQLEKHEVDEQIKKWLEAGIIRPSYSEYASPIVLVRKKNGEFRMCVDFRKLNQKIVQERYPIPNIEDQLDNLQGTKIFTTIDLRNGFFHLPLEEDSCKYTAFVTHAGQHEFLKTPFGLSISPASFQRYINYIFRDLIQRKIMLVVMDDIVILAKDEEEALERLKMTLRRAEEYGLEIQWKKCQFLCTEIEYLGHQIKYGTIQPSKLKTEAVLKFPEPTTTKQVQSFLGLTGYFRKFIKGYSQIAKPLSDLLRKDTPFTFSSEQEKAFEELKRILSSKPVLSIYSPEADTELHTDASKDGFGAILLQKNENSELHPIHYFSKKTSPAEAKYCSYELEVLAIIYAIKRFRHYLLGTPFKIVTDCAAFTQTMNKKELATRVARWALLLEEFNYTIEHRAGQRMKHTDALSRNTVLTLTENSIIEVIKSAQIKDEKLQTIIKLLNEGHTFQDYFMKNDVLYKNFETRELLVVPTKMHSEIIRRTHEENGHFKAKKVEDVILREFWIPQLREKIKSCVANCVRCILMERKAGKAEGFLHPIQKDDIPLTTYHVDHLGPLSSTKKGYKYLLVVVDGFSKFVWMYPTKTVTSEEVIQKLEGQEGIFGNPQRIIADRGTAFTSAAFRNYCTERDIDLVHITTGVARANGQVERLNRTIIPVLAKLSTDDESKWYQHVQKVQWMLNKTVQRSINTTPFQLLFGVEMRRSEDVKLKEAIQEEFYKSFNEDRERLRSEAKKEIQKIQDENTRTFNRRRKKANVYNVGDVVAIKRTQFCNLDKLKSKFLGPYRVIKTKRHERYDVEKIGCSDGPKKTATMAEFMKPWEGNYDSESEDAENDDGDVSETDTTEHGRDVGGDYATGKLKSDDEEEEEESRVERRRPRREQQRRTTLHDDDD